MNSLVKNGREKEIRYIRVERNENIISFVAYKPISSRKFGKVGDNRERGEKRAKKRGKRGEFRKRSPIKVYMVKKRYSSQRVIRISGN